ncbi:MAG: N-acetylmuramidase family protein [Gammaproteobacteria bacterium]|nr:N-acetylmuramidase family protein [Gammaproteobacteria bacterium]
MTNNTCQSQTEQAKISKKLTDEQLVKLANKHNINSNALRSVIKVECKGSGFDKNGKVKILFERHIFYKLLGKMKWWKKRKEFSRIYPSLCNKSWGGYNSHNSDQHLRLEIASNLVDSEQLKEVALMSCSWGLGQIMGYHYEKLGYESIQQFVDCMNESEEQQLEAMIRFLEVNNLVDKLNNQDWASFALAYNGKAYKKNRYDEKLAKAFNKIVA